MKAKCSGPGCAGLGRCRLRLVGGMGRLVGGCYFAGDGGQCISVNCLPTLPGSGSVAVGSCFRRTLDFLN